MYCKCKLAIFDLDGTLFDTKNVNFNAYRLALEEFGFSLDYNYYCRECNGKKYTQFLPALCNTSDDIIKKIHLKKKEYYSDFLSHAIPNNELFDIIDGLQSKYYIALVTTASRKNTLEILDFFGKKSCFDLILTQDEICNPKPDPQGFVKAMQYFNMNKENVIIFEDSDVGIEAAKKVTEKVYIVKGFN